MTIPCGDYYDGSLGTIPSRVTESNPDALKDRWGNFVYNMDLSPSPDDDELGNAYGAWALWDIPTSIAAQIDDSSGNDMICVAIQDRVYYLDWKAYRDEWDYNVYAPIYRYLKIGPLPSSEDATEKGQYQVDRLKRFREFRFDLRQAPTDPDTHYRIQVMEHGNEQRARRYGNFKTRFKNRARIALKGIWFTVKLEHSANEQFSPQSWAANWDIFGERIPRNRKSG